MPKKLGQKKRLGQNKKVETKQKLGQNNIWANIKSLAKSNFGQNKSSAQLAFKSDENKSDLTSKVTKTKCAPK